jgi:hypothetical protein
MATATDPRIPGHTIVEWARDLLARMGITPKPVSVDALVAWAGHESGGYNPRLPGGLYNPLNTTEGALGYCGQGGSQGNIKDFCNYDQGVAAQAYNLTRTRGVGYEAIVAGLREGTSLQTIFDAVNASRFGTKGLRAGGGAGAVPNPAGDAVDGQLVGEWYDRLNPLTYLGGILGGVKADIFKVGLTLAFIGAGLTLTVLGAWRSVAPRVRARQQEVADQLEPLAAAATKGAV